MDKYLAQIIILHKIIDCAFAGLDETVNGVLVAAMTLCVNIMYYTAHEELNIDPL